MGSLISSHIRVFASLTTAVVLATADTCWQKQETHKSATPERPPPPISWPPSLLVFTRMFLGYHRSRHQQPSSLGCKENLLQFCRVAAKNIPSRIIHQCQAFHSMTQSHSEATFSSTAYTVSPT